MVCDTNCDKPPKIDVEVIFLHKTKTLNPLRINRFRFGGIIMARTYDLHDVNVAL